MCRQAEKTAVEAKKAELEAKIRETAENRRRAKREPSPIRLRKGDVGNVIDLTAD